MSFPPAVHYILTEHGVTKVVGVGLNQIIHAQVKWGVRCEVLRRDGSCAYRRTGGPR
ncbi:hypothetical protein [Streptomyces sp. NPDC048611]|uniref:hypothetical protein n=1 Tax=Streptomyces sp. NPDC048611 TaxID=3155635 RepID=UPI003434D65C